MIRFGQPEFSREGALFFPTQRYKYAVMALRIASVTAAMVLMASGTAQAAGVTLETLLAEMVDRAAVARWPQPEFTCRQASSYDRSRIGPDKPGWFANHDSSQYIRAETHAGRTEQVMLDTDGPGAIVRFWVTSDRRRQGTLRIYLDGKASKDRSPISRDGEKEREDETATLEIPSYDLMASHWTGSPLLHPHTSYDPNGGGGSTLYLPIPYAHHCKVTWEEADPKSDAPRYYQIDYRTYRPGIAVETFSLSRLQAAKKTLDRVNQLLKETSAQLSDLSLGSRSDVIISLEPSTGLKPGSKPTGAVVSDPAVEATQAPVPLAPGASVSLPLPPGANAVQALEMQVATERPEDREQALRGTVVRMEFDGEETVWCPVSDFAGCGVGTCPLQSWYRTVGEDGQMLCRWVMPYARSGRITLTNLSKSPVNVQLTARVEKWRWDSRSLHFHATWRHQAQVPTKPDSDWNFVQIQGQGLLVGDVETVFNPVPAWYGEGDEKIWVDDDAFPSTLGTGTEDYYNASWAPTPTYQTPFANAPRIDNPKSQGNNTNTRTRNLDTIPFKQKLNFDMEIEHWQDPRIDIGAVVYWYARPGTTSNRPPLPEEATRPLAQLPQPYRIADALEFENAMILSKTEGMFVGPQEMSPFANATAKWSNDTQLICKANKPGDFVELQFAVPNGLHRLTLYATRAPDFGIVNITLNGAPATQEFDGYAPTVIPSGKIDLGVFMVTNGLLRLRFEVRDANQAAVGARYFFGLDCLVLDPKE